MSMNSFHARQKKPRPAPQPAHERPAGMHAGGCPARRPQPRPVAHRGATADRGRARRLGRRRRSPSRRWNCLPKRRLTVAADADAHFVSRGGQKLAGALAQTGLSVAGKPASMSVNAPAASPIACCRTVPGMSSASTSATTSCMPNCAATRRSLPSRASIAAR